MTRRLPVAALLLLAGAAWAAAGTPPAPELVQKIRSELSGPPTEDSKYHADVPHGELVEGTLNDSKSYPGTENSFKVYVPAQYSPDKPACLLFRLDGIGKNEAAVLDNLIAKGDMPVTIAVGLSSGTIWKTKGSAAYRWNRSYEFDSTNGIFPGFVLDELLPKVESLTTKDGRPIRLSHDAKDRAVTGASTGGIGSFTLAWERPDSFSRVYSVIGTFVSMRGGNDYPALVRKYEPKPIRIFLEDGSTDAWNPLFGTWFMANENMDAAFTFAGYDEQHAWGVHGHDGGPGSVILPDVLRWLWRGWPAPVEAGTSSNDMLLSILRPGEGWQPVPGEYASAKGLAAGPGGEVYFSDPKKHILWRIGGDGTPRVFSKNIPDLGGEACGPDGALYACSSGESALISFDKQGTARTIVSGIRGDRVLVTSGNAIYMTEPGAHSDELGSVWSIAPGGEKTLLDRSLSSSSGITFSPDNALFFAAERGTNRVYSFIAADGSTLKDKEPYYWLHAADLPDDAGNGDLAVDLSGDLYVATRLGIQVCDRNGRVRAILWLPTPSGPVEGLCWAGSAFDTLYATDGTLIFKRVLKIPGHPPWGAPIVLPPSNAG